MNTFTKRFKNSSIEIFHFLYFLLRVDKKFLASVLFSCVLLIVSVTRAFVEVDAFSLLGIAGATIGFITSFLRFRKYGSGGSKSELFSERKNSIITSDSSVYFKDIQPSINECSEGFSTLDSGYNSGEHAVRSESFDNWLLEKQPTISVSISKDSSFSYCDTKDRDGYIGVERFTAQLKYLYYKVFQPSLTKNEKKFRISSLLKKGCTSIQLSKVGYFDALVTNEAYRSILYQRPFGSNLTHNVNVVSDLRKYYPYDQVESELHLKELDSKIAAGHVGISTLVISKDNYPIFFEQAKWNDQMAGTLVVSGSGSVNFSDIKKSQSDSLLDIIKYSMAREFCEEGSQQLEYIKNLAKNTIIIGYFRWIDRCGKPEFLGLTKSDKTKEEITADYEEVLPISTTSSNHKVIDTNDFYFISNHIKREIQDTSLRVGRSSAMVLHRLNEISLKGNKEPEYIIISNFLKP